QGVCDAADKLLIAEATEYRSRRFIAVSPTDDKPITSPEMTTDYSIVGCIAYTRVGGASTFYHTWFIYYSRCYLRQPSPGHYECDFTLADSEAD
ncbi:MAG: hypothetical protein WBV36_26505, partial [Terriglobales bacterium]